MNKYIFLAGAGRIEGWAGLFPIWVQSYPIWEHRLA